MNLYDLFPPDDTDVELDRLLGRLSSAPTAIRGHRNQTRAVEAALGLKVPGLFRESLECCVRHLHQELELRRAERDDLDDDC